MDQYDNQRNIEHALKKSLKEKGGKCNAVKKVTGYNYKFMYDDK